MWPHVCLLFHKHRGCASPDGTSKRAKRNREQSENQPEQTTGRAGDVTAQADLSEATDVDQTGVTECVLGFVFVCAEVVPAVQMWSKQHHE